MAPLVLLAKTKRIPRPQYQMFKLQPQVSLALWTSMFLTPSMMFPHFILISKSWTSPIQNVYGLGGTRTLCSLRLSHHIGPIVWNVVWGLSLWETTGYSLLGKLVFMIFWIHSLSIDLGCNIFVTATTVRHGDSKIVMKAAVIGVIAQQRSLTNVYAFTRKKMPYWKLDGIVLVMARSYTAIRESFHPNVICFQEY